MVLRVLVSYDKLLTLFFNCTSIKTRTSVFSNPREMASEDKHDFFSVQAVFSSNFRTPRKRAPSAVLL